MVQKESYNNAYFTNDDKKLAREVVELSEWMDEIRIIDYPMIRIVENRINE